MAKWYYIKFIPNDNAINGLGLETSFTFDESQNFHFDALLSVPNLWL